MIIALSDTGAPVVDQIQDQIRGLITIGAMSADQRLPSVRQLAADLGVAPGTVAKAYRALESDGFLVSRIGSGTRVSGTAATTARDVLQAARRFAGAAERDSLDLEDAVRILRAIWQA